MNTLKQVLHQDTTAAVIAGVGSVMLWSLLLVTLVAKFQVPTLI